MTLFGAYSRQCIHIRGSNHLINNIAGSVVAVQLPMKTANYNGPIFGTAKRTTDLGVFHLPSDPLLKWSQEM